jgi:hypothetical protein
MSLPYISDILIDAKARLTPDNWAQATWDGGIPDDKCCPALAIGAACIDMSVPLRLRYKTLDFLACVVTGFKGGSLTRWNDEPGRTFEHISSAFDAAIAIARVNELKVSAAHTPEQVTA